MKIQKYKNIEQITLVNGDIIYPRYNDKLINIEPDNTDSCVVIISCEKDCNKVKLSGETIVLKPGIIGRFPMSSILFFQLEQDV